MKNINIFLGCILTIFLSFSCEEDRYQDRKDKEKSLNKYPINTQNLDAITTNRTQISIYRGKVKIELPTELAPMKEDMVEVKYPYSKEKDMVVYSDEEGEVSIAFELTSTPLTQYELSEAVNSTVRRFNNEPTIDVVSYDIKKINGNRFGLIEFYSRAVDSQVYNYMFITSLNDTALTGSFNCVKLVEGIWKNRAIEIIDSIKILH